MTHTAEKDARCWRSECRTRCYYPQACSERSTAENDAGLFEPLLADCPTHGRVHHLYRLAPDAFCCRLGCGHFIPAERVTPPAGGYERAMEYADDIADLMSDSPEDTRVIPPGNGA